MWVAFGGLGRDEIGWGRKISGGDYAILYSEGQMYDEEIWDKPYVKEFPSLQSAIKYVIDLTDENETVLYDRIQRCFPNHVKNNP